MNAHSSTIMTTTQFYCIKCGWLTYTKCGDCYQPLCKECRRER